MTTATISSCVSSTRKLRIGLLIETLHGHGGLERRTCCLAQGLMNAGHEVDIFANRWEKGILPGAHFHFIPIFKLNRPFKDLTFSWFSAVIARRVPLDIIHTQTRVCKYDIATLGGGCYQAYLNAMQIKPRALKERVALAIEKAMVSELGFREGRQIILNSRMCRDEYIEHYGVPEKNLEVVYNGVDSEAFYPRPEIRAACREEFGLSPGDIAVLFVGPGFQRKGLDTLIQAVSDLPDCIKILVVGGGQIDHPRIVRIGQTDSMNKCYAAADIFALPTRYDPFANSTLEALASGLPVITTSSNGVSEIVKDGESAFIISANDRGALTERLKALIDDPRQRERLGLAGRAAVKPFTWEETTRKTMAVYEKIVNEKK
ncbi:MAG: glycosyltransferase family 4 protein [Deltaproteobacteria bacterium]